MKDINQIPIIAGSRVKQVNGPAFGLVRFLKDTLYLWDGHQFTKRLVDFKPGELKHTY